MFAHFGIKDILDILIVATLLYSLYRLMKESGSINIFTGVLIFIGVWVVVTRILDMKLMGAIMDKLTSEGKSIIFISHKMREVLRVSDRITILRAGETVCTLNRGETSGQELANLMIGRELSPSHYEKRTVTDEPVVALQNVDYHKEAKHDYNNQ